jgi:spermidine/putrescine transport system permease protein
MSSNAAPIEPPSVDPMYPGAPPELPPAEARSARGPKNRRALTLAAPAAGYLILFLVVPVITLLAYSVLTAGFFSASTPFTLDNYKQALESDLTWQLGRNSLIVGALTAGISVLIAVPVAYWLRYHAGRWQLPVMFLIALSMFASYLVRIYAWRTILGTNGVLNTALIDLGLIDHPSSLFIFNQAAIVIALVHISVPYVVLVMFAAFRPIEPRYLEAARDLGGGAAQRWRRVILPLIAGPAISAFIFIFVLASADFVTPQFLGGPGDAMLGISIAQQFTASGNWALAAALSGLMLIAYAICFAIAALGLRLAGLSRIRWTT